MEHSSAKEKNLDSICTTCCSQTRATQITLTRCTRCGLAHYPLIVDSLHGHTESESKILADALSAMVRSMRTRILYALANEFKVPAAGLDSILEPIFWEQPKAKKWLEPVGPFASLAFCIGSSDEFAESAVKRILVDQFGLPSPILLPNARQQLPERY
jgi:hypothetical protein